ncbi:hypothetical protein EJ06DRAFT_535983 [Trichodelitschia bisporula]|uniref:Sequence orphan n=1 Tax=Trichodelitschia bisporula TaxID=703511 RepID=A0A6G1I5U7_9PEZI|nr:hypothetical protein EJ06DRAFT_535983 [Trichodelitschia bisporula]
MPQTRGYNTAHLPARVTADIAAAACAGVLVAPVITVIDRGIIENASGTRTLGASVIASLRLLLTRPHAFVFSKPFALVFTLYTGTYLTANTVDTLSSTLGPSPPSTVTFGAPKFLATSSANLALCLWKDTHFTRLFGLSSPRALPPATYALFTLRDCLTIGASFNLPPLLAPYVPLGLRQVTGWRPESVAQFIAPAAVQVVSTPMHLLGLDWYNRAGGEGVGGRWRRVRGAWGVSVLARVGRIVPAFGVGGVVNSGVRRELMGGLE